MVQLNGVDYDYRLGMSVKEFIEENKSTHPKMGLDELVIICNDEALTVLQAHERIIQDRDSIRIVPILDGG